jgi:hypothetical protein
MRLPGDLDKLGEAAGSGGPRSPLDSETITALVTAAHAHGWVSVAAQIGTEVLQSLCPAGRQQRAGAGGVQGTSGGGADACGGTGDAAPM